MGLPKRILQKLFMKDGTSELAFKNLSRRKLLGAGMNSYFAVSGYQDSRAEGNGVISSAVSSAGDFALGYLIGWPAYLAMDGIPALASFGVDAYDSLSAYSRQLQKQRRNVPFQNATFVDSQQTYTMRQAGMNLARQGQMAAQQTTLGNEAAQISYMGR